MLLKILDAPPAWREAFLKFHAMLDSDQAGAAALLQTLMAERPADRAIQNLAGRVLPPGKPGLMTVSAASTALE